MFELFRGPHWTLMQYDAGMPAAIAVPAGVRCVTIGENGDIHDTGGFIAQTYDLRAPDSVLIRPDGYIGAFSPAGKEAVLRKYFEQVLPRNAGCAGGP